MFYKLSIHSLENTPETKKLSKLMEKQLDTEIIMEAMGSKKGIAEFTPEVH